MALYDENGMIAKPNNVSERWFRSMFARTETIEVNGQEYEFQSVSPQWYYQLSDQCGIGKDRQDSVRYMDQLFKNVVISPPEVAAKGFRYFDENHDLESSELLMSAIERFLRPGRKFGRSGKTSTKE